MSSLALNPSRRKTLSCAALWLAGGALPRLAQAASPPQLVAPTGKVVLSVTGRIGSKNSPDAALIDMAQIVSLPQHDLRTKTPWHRGVVRFQGPLLRDVLALVQAQGTSLLATAINDFFATIPMSDVQDHAVLLAHSIDGKRLTVRDKGPLFVIYPFDQNPALKSSTYYARSVWQLRHLDVR